jgi:deoxycytidylate deaminase
MNFQNFEKNLFGAFDLLKKKDEKYDPRNWEKIWPNSSVRWILKFLAQAMIASVDSTCLNRHTGACLVDIKVQQNGDLAPFALSSCFNGAPTGIEPCSLSGQCHYKEMAFRQFLSKHSVKNGWKEKFKEFKKAYFQYCVACHAEANAIYFSPMPAFNKLMFATTDPCPECAKLIVQKGVGAVIFAVPYKADEKGIVRLADQSRYLFERANIPCVNINVPTEYFPWILDNIKKAGQAISDHKYD